MLHYSSDMNNTAYDAYLFVTLFGLACFTLVLIAVLGIWTAIKDMCYMARRTREIQTRAANRK